MGTVYLAYDAFSDDHVAIKVAHPQFIAQTENGDRFKKLFFNEAHAAGVLDHSNILRIHDADIDGELCYLVMEYIKGADTLQSFCKPTGLLPMRDVVGLMYKSAKALDYAHRQGVIHRDVKPTNILYTDDKDIKIADFSIAMITRADAAQTQFTGFMGSPMYMSPEQITEKEIGTATDIFSLGVVMYEMLTGHNPFESSNITALSQKITKEEPAPLEIYRRDLPEHLEYILGRMLKKSPRKRYASGLDLAADLSLLFEDLDAVDTEDSLREKFEALKGLGFFKSLTDADIWELVRACAWDKIPAGTTIIKEGDLDHSFYILLSGVVAVEKQGRLVGALQEGDCFGEMGYLSKSKRTATVKAKTDVSFIKVNAATLDRAAEGTQLRFLKAFVNTLMERLVDTTSALARL